MRLNHDINFVTFYRWLMRSYLFLVVLSLCFYLFVQISRSHFFSIKSEKEKELTSSLSPPRKEKEKIVGYAITLLPSSYHHPSLKDLKEEMSIFILPQRPDKKVAVKYELQLTRSGQSRVVSPALDVPIIYDREKKAWILDSKGDGFILSLQPMDETNVKIEVGSNSSDPLFLEYRNGIDSFVIHTQLSPKIQKDVQRSTPFQELSKAKWWGEDLIFPVIQEGEQCLQKQCLELVDHRFLSVSEKEVFIWKEGKWQEFSDLEETENYPIARVHMIQGKMMRIEGWEDDSYFRFILYAQPQAPWRTRPEDWISHVAVRSRSQLSIVFEKQRLILRPKMWAYRKKSRWYSSRRLPERMSEGDVDVLFFLDSIQQDEGKRWMKAYFFDSKGVLIYPLEKTLEKRGQRRSHSMPTYANANGTESGGYET